MRQIKSPKGFPLTVKRGSVSVRIYYTPNRGRDCFTVSYCNPTRKRKTFAELEPAKLEAERIATQLATGAVDLTKISSADWACYIRAKQLADSISVPLDSVAAILVEATKRLGSIPLATAIEYFLKKHPKDLQPRLIQDVITEMLEFKRQDGLNAKYLLHLRYDLNKFAAAFHCNIAAVTGQEIDAWLRGLGLAARSRNNLRTAVQTLFSYAKLKKYLPKDHDELDAVPLAKGNGTEIEIFTPFDLEALLNCADVRLVPFLALGAFAGVRHAEIQRLDWQDIKFDADLIEIKAAKAKTASRRTVPILPNLKAWLQPYAKPTGPVCVYKNVANEINKLVRDVQNLGRALKWKHNGLRHSFISYRIAQIQNVAQVALEAGNSPQIIFRNYRELVRPADAEKWFSIVPKQTGNIVVLPQITASTAGQEVLAGA
jgi:integrase